MSDKETLSAYNARATDYADRFGKKESEPRLDAFLDRLPAGGRVLDLGCGPARSAAQMIERGFEVDALDASEGMAKVALERFGIKVRVATFDAVDAEDHYDGVWANFSLLHAPRAEFPGHIARLHKALKAGGLLHLGLKTGTGEERDSMGRMYSFFSPDEIRETLTASGFTVLHEEEGEERGFAGTLDPWIIVTASR